MANLRTLASFYRAIQDQIEEAGGEVTDEILEDLTRYEDDIDSKIDSMAVLMTDALMWAERHRADAAESSEMAKKKFKQIERMKSWMKRCLDEGGIPRAGRKYPYVVRDNSVPVFTWQYDTNLIPEEFRKVVPVELDTMKCRRLYMEGGKSSILLPDGINVAKGRHVQAAYPRNKNSEEDGNK